MTVLLWIVNVPVALRNMINPLDKILEGIPAGSSNFIHASVTHYTTDGSSIFLWVGSHEAL
jgi:hypothetical protein